MVAPTVKRAATYAAVVVALVGAGVVSTVALRRSSNREDRLPSIAAPVPVMPALDSGSASLLPAPEPTGLRVLALEGDVAKVPASTAKPRLLSLGDVVAQTEGVRTGDRARVQLGLGEKSTLELRERGELRVVPDDREGQRLKLLGGRVEVEYRETNQKLRIESRDGDAVVAAENGAFAVLQAGETLAVANRVGSVDLSAGGQVQAVPEGTQSIVSGGSISTPQAIPVDLVLRIVDPGCIVQREFFIVLSGRTAPGARVMAGNIPATVKPDGRFFVRVPLKLGRNEIEIVSEDVSGHRKTRSFSCVTVDPGAPINEIDIQWGPTRKTRSSP